MNVTQFSDAQKDHYIIIPEVLLDDEDLDKIPFEKLLNGKESDEAMMKRWELYDQLHSSFHAEVEKIVENIEHDLKDEISNVLFNDQSLRKPRACFKSLFLLGSDSSTKIETPKSTTKVFNILIELTPKECPNVRMVLRRSMFELYSTIDKQLKNETFIDNEEFTKKNKRTDSSHDNDEQLIRLDTSYDLTLLEHFKKLFGRNLNLVINFKEMDSINPIVVDNFIILLKNALKHEHIEISLVFNINTNLSNVEKNFKHSTMRLLKKNYHILDVSSNKGFKYENRIFQSFLDTVDGKLNLSDRFVEFILKKIANTSNHSLQLLTKILDYGLMAYFFQNPFSIFIDPVNIEILNDDYLEILTRCPTFMFFIEGLIKQHAPHDEIMGLLTNADNTLEGFFTEFLVRENPTNRHAKLVSTFLENDLKIKNYNFIELYYELLKDKLDKYLSKWPECEKNKDLNFEPVDTMFQELFTLDNNNNLLSQALFPTYKNNIEDNLLRWEGVLPRETDIDTNTVEAIKNFGYKVPPILGHLFKLYREANYQFNLYDLFIVFKDTLPKEEILKFLHDENQLNSNKKLKELVINNDDNVLYEKVTLVLFLQAVSEFEHMGIIKPVGIKNNSDQYEKVIWRGI